MSATHDRIDCSDSHPVNAQADGSNGCARCTQIIMNQRDQLLAALKAASILLDRLDAPMVDNTLVLSIRAAILAATGEVL